MKPGSHESFCFLVVGHDRELRPLPRDVLYKSFADGSRDSGLHLEVFVDAVPWNSSSPKGFLVHDVAEQLFLDDLDSSVVRFSSNNTLNSVVEPGPPPPVRVTACKVYRGLHRPAE